MIMIEYIYTALIFLGTFLAMEFMAWFTHKYVMHGFLWSLHKDHHFKNHKHWWERNDLFFTFYAAVSMFFFMTDYVPYSIAIGAGISAYGLTYFLVHDVFIHRRLTWFNRANNWYAKAVRKAHRKHHTYLRKDGGECFGMLLPPMRFFKSK